MNSNSDDLNRHRSVNEQIVSEWIKDDEEAVEAIEQITQGEHVYLLEATSNADHYGFFPESRVTHSRGPTGSAERDSLVTRGFIDGSDNSWHIKYSILMAARAALIRLRNQYAEQDRQYRQQLGLAKASASPIIDNSAIQKALQAASENTVQREKLKAEVYAGALIAKQNEASEALRRGKRLHSRIIDDYLGGDNFRGGLATWIVIIAVSSIIFFVVGYNVGTYQITHASDKKNATMPATGHPKP